MFLLHVSYASGAIETLTFPSRFDRSLVLVSLAAQPVGLRTEDPRDGESQDTHTDALEQRLLDAFGPVKPGQPIVARHGDPCTGYTPRGRFGRRVDGRPVRLDGPQGPDLTKAIT